RAQPTTATLFRRSAAYCSTIGENQQRYEKCGLTFLYTLPQTAAPSGAAAVSRTISSTAASAAPFEGARLDRVREGPTLGAGAVVFALQPVVPFRLGIRIVD